MNDTYLYPMVLIVLDVVFEPSRAYLGVCVCTEVEISLSMGVVTQRTCRVEPGFFCPALDV